MLRLVTDVTLTEPRAGTVGGAGEAALRELATAIATLQFLLQSFGATLEHGIRGNANNIRNAKELAELIEERQSLGRRLQYNRGTEKTSRTDQERHPAGKDTVPRG